LDICRFIKRQMSDTKLLELFGGYVSIFGWFSKKKSDESLANISQGAQDFIDGKKNTLTSADIDPEGTALFNNYLKAMELKKEEKFSEAESLLIMSTKPPSVYKGHYRELFKLWRQFNREDLKAKKYQEVMDRVVNMYHLDSEMIDEMLRYWSIQQKRKLPKDYFDKSRNLLISDAKALKKSAESLGNEGNLILANKLIGRFGKK